MPHIFIGPAVFTPGNTDYSLWDRLHDKFNIPGFHYDYFHRISSDADIAPQFWGVNLFSDAQKVNAQNLNTYPAQSRNLIIKPDLMLEQINTLKNLDSIQPYFKALEDSGIEYSIEFIVSELRF